MTFLQYWRKPECRLVGDIKESLFVKNNNIIVVMVKKKKICLPWIPSEILVGEMTSCWGVILNLCRAEEGGGGDERVPPLLTVLNWVHGNMWIQPISCFLYWGECLKISVIKSEEENVRVVKCVNAGGIRVLVSEGWSSEQVAVVDLSLAPSGRGVCVLHRPLPGSGCRGSGPKRRAG